jgi:hypothetical protein
VRDRPSRPTGRGQCLLRDAVGGGPQPQGGPGEVSLARPSAQRRAIARPPRTQRPGCARGASCESVAERSRKPPSRWGSALGPALRSSSVPPPGEGATSPPEASATPAQPEVLSPGNLLGAGWGTRTEPCHGNWAEQTWRVFKAVYYRWSGDLEPVAHRGRLVGRHVDGGGQERIAEAPGQRLRTTS